MCGIRTPSNQTLSSIQQWQVTPVNPASFLFLSFPTCTFIARCFGSAGPTGGGRPPVFGRRQVNKSQLDLKSLQRADDFLLEICWSCCPSRRGQAQPPRTGCGTAWWMGRKRWKRTKKAKFERPGRRKYLYIKKIRVGLRSVESERLTLYFIFKVVIWCPVLLNTPSSDSVHIRNDA